MKNIISQIISFLIFFSSIFISIEKCEADTISDSLKYIGHAFVKIKTSEGKVIYIDPYAANEFTDSADVVLITHEHPDHNDLTRVKQKATCQVIRSVNAIQSGVYQSFIIGNIKVTAVPAYNSHHLKSECVGYVIEFNGIKLYHAGDTGKIPEMADLANQNITYALLPMEGLYNMTPEEATQAAAMIQAKHDIPIHTMPPPDTYSDAIVARFTSPNKLVVHPNETIVLSSSPTFIENAQIYPLTSTLEQNYPNPFNPHTRIRFKLAHSCYTSLEVFNLFGQRITTLISSYLAAGIHEFNWNASYLPSGVYYYRLGSGDFVDIKKLVLLR
jgi:L-ascorbate metabolism protein UlaG (beta-lactamase superfamily)